MNRSYFKNLPCKLGVILLIISTVNVKAQNAARYPLIPYPTKLIEAKGSFIVTGKTNIVAMGQFKSEAEMLSQLLGGGLGAKIAVGEATWPHSIKLVCDGNITAPEGYKLSITPQQVIIAAKYPAGIFHAIETIRQLLPVSVEQGITHKQL